jgi:hypothetical protein
MMTISDFVGRHWIPGGILTSLLWFIAGRQYLSSRQRFAAMGWQSIAVIIGSIMCSWCVAEREWLGLAAGIVVVFIEVRSIRRFAVGNERQ